MRLSIGKTLKVNMGNYEHIELGAHVTLEEGDYDPEVFDGMTPGERMGFLLKEARVYQDDYLEPELKRAAELSQAEASMLIDPEPAPRRTERTTRRRSTR